MLVFRGLTERQNLRPLREPKLTVLRSENSKILIAQFALSSRMIFKVLKYIHYLKCFVDIERS